MIYYERGGIVVRTSCESDIEALKNRLREADEKEIIAAGNADGEAVLRHSFTRSTLRYTVDLEGVPVAMFGIVPDSILGRRANVWFLGAPEMARIKKTFVRLSRHFIGEFLAQYPELWNLVDARYVQTLRWLESCGAVINARPIMMGDVPFYGFEIRRA